MIYQAGRKDSKWSLLCGLPGMGKTLLTKAVTGIELHLDVLLLDPMHLLTFSLPLLYIFFPELSIHLLHNLFEEARASAPCSNLPPEGHQMKLGPGLLDLLMKSVSHPSVNICGISIDVLAKLLVSSEKLNLGLFNQLLAILQQ
jgi:hypothetical protein